MLRRLALPLLLASACGSPPAAPSSSPPSTDESAPGSSPHEAGSTPTAAVPSEGPGLAVGERALAFALVDQHGKTRALDEWLGKGLVAVVFFRSADW